AVLAADFNGDGLPDVVTANRGGNDVGVLLGEGNGSFEARSITTRPRTSRESSASTQPRLHPAAPRRGVVVREGERIPFEPDFSDQFLTGLPEPVLVSSVMLTGTPPTVSVLSPNVSSGGGPSAPSSAGGEGSSGAEIDIAHGLEPSDRALLAGVDV